MITIVACSFAVSFHDHDAEVREDLVAAVLVQCTTRAGLLSNEPTNLYMYDRETAIIGAYGPVAADVLQRLLAEQQVQHLVLPPSDMPMVEVTVQPIRPPPQLPDPSLN